MDERLQEISLDDHRQGGLVMPVGSRSGGERSDSERRDPTGVQVAGVSTPDPEVPAKT
jgi:hypothetical protein